MSALPNDLALTVINDGSEIDAAAHRNNYATIQTGFNAVRDALAGGTAGQVVTVVDSTHIALALIVDANIDPAAAIALSKLSAAVTLDAIATAHATAADVVMNSHKLTGLAAGSGNGDSVRYEQLATLADKASASTQVFTGQVEAPSYMGVFAAPAAVVPNTSYTPNFAADSYEYVTVSPGGAGTTLTINPPSNPPDATHTGLLRLAFVNTSGAFSVALTWSAAANGYVATGVTLPGSLGTSSTVRCEFVWNGTLAKWELWAKP